MQPVPCRKQNSPMQEGIDLCSLPALPLTLTHLFVFSKLALEHKLWCRGELIFVIGELGDFFVKQN